MTDIYPAESGSVSDVINTLQRLGFTDGKDFWLHYTWDYRPFVQTTPQTYEAWSNEVGATADQAEPAAEPDTAGQDDGDEKADESGGENNAGDAKKSASTQDDSGAENDSGNGRKSGKRR